MIHPSTQVQCLDITDGTPKYKSIEELFQEYSHKSVVMSDSNNVKETIIDFSPDSNIKITDLFGWTDLLMIKKTSYRYPLRMNWMDILVANKQLITCNRELLPIYDISDEKIGFHGEVKFKYILTNPSKVTSGYLRIHNGEDPNGNPVEFAEPEIINPDKSGAIPELVGYEIITRSRFYNGNDIHLFGSDYINLEEASNWYK